jgi:hypothetical protein
MDMVVDELEDIFMDQVEKPAIVSKSDLFQGYKFGQRGSRLKKCFDVSHPFAFSGIVRQLSAETSWNHIYKEGWR